jgi:hypothetical protein
LEQIGIAWNSVLLKLLTSCFRTIAQSSGEVIEDRHPLHTSFLIQGGFFLPPIKIKNVIVPLFVSSMKALKDYLLRSKDFAHMVNNIS